MTWSQAYRVNSPQVVCETIDNEVVVVNLETGHYYSLDGSAASIWSLIEVGATAREIVEGLRSRYSGGGNDLEAATTEFLHHLKSEGLVVPCSAESPRESAGVESPSRAVPSEARPPFPLPALHKYTDMQDMLLLDPIHDVDESGWPTRKPELSI